MTNIKVLSPAMRSMWIARSLKGRRAPSSARCHSLVDRRRPIWRIGDRPGQAADGTAEETAEVVLWARALLPDDPGGRIWMVDEGFTGHVELVPDMSPEMLRDGWVDHDEQPPAY